MHALFAALLDWTCLGSASREAPAQPDLSKRAAWLSWLGIPAGCLVAGFYYPLAAAILPPDVVLVAALCVQAYLLAFHAEAGLAALSGHRGSMPRGPGAVSLAILMKLVILRQFFPEEAARLLMLGTIVGFGGPALLLLSLRHRVKEGETMPPFSALVPIVAAAGGISALAARAPSDLPPAGRAVMGAVAILACIALARIIVAAFVRERRGEPEGPLLFAASLPCEIAAIGGYLLVRFI